MTSSSARRRMLLVHAHPDDETLANGATMAKYAAEDVDITLVTCTRGEEGLVLVPELGHLAAHDEDRLGEHRELELAAAMTALGVRDHRFLDTVRLPAEDDADDDAEDDTVPAHYRDSGMAWDEDHWAVPAPDTGPTAFARADLDEAAARVAAVVREVHPHVLVTYEPEGGYGHPDHVQAHRVAMRGAELAAGDVRPDLVRGRPWGIPKIYWTVLPEGEVRAALRALAEAGETAPGWTPDGPLPPMVVPDELVTAAIDGRSYVDRKVAALRAHATQVSVDAGTVTIGDGAAIPVAGVEYYRLVVGRPAGPLDADGRETDLFAGVDPDIDVTA